MSYHYQAATSESSQSKVLLGNISFIHAVSHIHIMMLPALIPILPSLMNVTFVELGIALSVFSIVSVIVQAPLGVFVDRIGPRKMLIGALLLGSLSFGLVSIFTSYIALLIAMFLAGIANGVYHPANYSILSRNIDSNKIGKAFSIHTFSGFLGGAITPLVVINIALTFNVHLAFAFASFISLLALFSVFKLSESTTIAKPIDGEKSSYDEIRPSSISIYTITILTLFFTLLSLSMGAIEKFSVSSLTQGFNVNLTTANFALTGFMLASACGVLTGGFITGRIKRHGIFVTVAFSLAALIFMLVIMFNLSAISLIISFCLAGFLMGVIAPSRDMLVRNASPIGAEGRTFGIVTTGLNFGGIVGPILFSFLLDRNLAVGIIWSAVGFIVLTVIVAVIQEYITYRNISHHSTLI